MSRLSPGLPDAIAAGCTCRHVDNFDGRGCSPHLGEPRRFIVETTCPLHGFDVWPTTGAQPMRLVILESPFVGAVVHKTAYARACVRDCLQRGESPIASHLLFTQDGILDDAVPTERQLGIDAGLAWYAAAEAAVFYMDAGMSRGMLGALTFLKAHRQHLPREWRFTAPRVTGMEMKTAFLWDINPLCVIIPRRHQICDTPLGRLEYDHNRRSPTQAAPFEVKLAGRTVAFYATSDQARAGAEHFYQWRIDHPKAAALLE